MLFKNYSKNVFLKSYRSTVSITGVWFYEESECTRIAQKLEALVKEESQRRRPNAAQDKSSVDILSLLTKAHGEYEQVVVARKQHLSFLLNLFHSLV